MSSPQNRLCDNSTVTSLEVFILYLKMTLRKLICPKKCILMDLPLNFRNVANSSVHSYFLAGIFHNNVGLFIWWVTNLWIGPIIIENNTMILSIFCSTHNDWITDSILRLCQTYLGHNLYCVIKLIIRQSKTYIFL